MLVAPLTAAVLSLVFCPLIIKLCQKFNLYDEVDARKIHKGQIPRLGGIAVFLSFLIVWILVRFVFKTISIDWFLPLFAGFGIILLFGILDDLFNMRAKLKFLVQIIAALIVSLSPNHFKTVFLLQLPPVAGEVITFIWILGIVNAFNLIDGMDWICGGLSFLSCLTLGLLFLFGENPMCWLYFVICGSLAGFLYWNKPDAKIFMGDGGSQSLGYLIAIAPLFNLKSVKFEYLQVAVMVLLCSIPVTDVIAAIWRRTREHRAIFSPDRAHIHHKLLNIGFSKKAAILFLLSIQGVICLAVLTSWFMGPVASMGLLLFCLIFVEGIFITFHYLNRAVNLAHKGLLEDHPMKEH